MEIQSAKMSLLKKILYFLAFLFAFEVGLYYHTSGIEINIFKMTNSLLAGLGIFMLNMTAMEKSLDAMSGEKIQNLLKGWTEKKFFGLCLGAGVTAVLGSSSLATATLVNLVGTGMLSFARSIPVIFGTNIGSTITLQLLTFNIDDYISIFIFATFLWWFINKNEKKLENGAYLLVSFALVFFALSLMKSAMVPLKTYPPFSSLMMHLENPLLGLLIGAIFSGLIQSSAGSVAIVVGLAMNSLVSLPAGIALILGIHIGKITTALIAGIGKNGMAKRVVWATIFYAVVSASIFIFLIPELTYAVEKIGGGIPRQIANAHTIFNVVAALMFLVGTSPFTRFIEWLVPATRTPEKGYAKPKYLRDEETMNGTLGILYALLGIKQELYRMLEIIDVMYREILQAILYGTIDDLKKIRDMDLSVNALHVSIRANIALLETIDKTHQQSIILSTLKKYANRLEKIGDAVKELTNCGFTRFHANLEISHETKKNLGILHSEIHTQILQLLIVISDSALSGEERKNTEEDIIANKKAIKSTKAETKAYINRDRTGESPISQQVLVMEDKIIQVLSSVNKKIAKLAALGISEYDFPSIEELELQKKELNEEILRD